MAVVDAAAAAVVGPSDREDGLPRWPVGYAGLTPWNAEELWTIPHPNLLRIDDKVPHLHGSLLPKIQTEVHDILFEGDLMDRPFSGHLKRIKPVHLDQFSLVFPHSMDCTGASLV